MIPPKAIFFAELCLIVTVLLQQTILDIPQLLGQVHIVGMRVVKALDLIPQLIHLFQTIGTDFLQAGTLIHKLAAHKKWEPAAPLR